MKRKLVKIDLDKLSKEYPSEWRGLLNDIHEAMKNSVVKDTRFCNKYDALLKKGDIKRAAQAWTTKHDAVEPGIARSVMKTYGVFRGKKTNPVNGNNNQGGNRGNNNAAAANQGWTRVSARPPNSAID